MAGIPPWLRRVLGGAFEFIRPRPTTAELYRTTQATIANQRAKMIASGLLTGEGSPIKEGVERALLTDLLGRTPSDVELRRAAERGARTIMERNKPPEPGRRILREVGDVERNRILGDIEARYGKAAAEKGIDPITGAVLQSPQRGRPLAEQGRAAIVLPEGEVVQSTMHAEGYAAAHEAGLTRELEPPGVVEGFIRGGRLVDDQGRVITRVNVGRTAGATEEGVEAQRRTLSNLYRRMAEDPKIRGAIGPEGRLWGAGVVPTALIINDGRLPTRQDLEARLKRINKLLMDVSTAKSEVFEAGAERDFNVGSVTGRSNIAVVDPDAPFGVSREADLQEEGYEIAAALRRMREAPRGDAHDTVYEAIARDASVTNADRPTIVSPSQQREIERVLNLRAAEPAPAAEAVLPEVPADAIEVKPDVTYVPTDYRRLREAVAYRAQPEMRAKSDVVVSPEQEEAILREAEAERRGMGLPYGAYRHFQAEISPWVTLGLTALPGIRGMREPSIRSVKALREAGLYPAPKDVEAIAASEVATILSPALFSGARKGLRSVGGALLRRFETPPIERGLTTVGERLMQSQGVLPPRPYTPPSPLLDWVPTTRAPRLPRGVPAVLGGSPEQLAAREATERIGGAVELAETAYNAGMPREASEILRRYLGLPRR